MLNEKCETSALPICCIGISIILLGDYLLENGFNDMLDGIVMMIFFGSIIPFMGKLLILIKHFTLSQQS